MDTNGILTILKNIHKGKLKQMKYLMIIMMMKKIK